MWGCSSALGRGGVMQNSVLKLGIVRSSLGLFVGLGLFLFVAGCGEEPVEEAPVVRPVKILQFGAKAMGGVLEYPGTIKPAQETQMSFEVAGKIIEFPVDEGQEVIKGTVLARLDPRDFELARDAELASYKAARAEFNRMQNLYKEDVISRQQFDLARRNFQVAESKFKTSDKALEDTALSAPYDGRVAKKLVAEFRNVQAKEAILILEDNSSLEVSIHIAERDWAAAKPGLTLAERTERVKPMLSLTSLPERSFPAAVKEIATTADPETRTYESTLSFAMPSDVTVLSGMTATVRFQVPEGSDLGVGELIPARAAIADEAGAAYVWKVDPDSMKVSRATVVLGELAGDEVAVLSGLGDGDLIATSGVHHLREGMQVRKYEE